jgi:hypothetical protein
MEFSLQCEEVKDPIPSHCDIQYVNAILSNHINCDVNSSVSRPSISTIILSSSIENARILLCLQSFLVCRCVLACLHLLGSYRVTATARRNSYRLAALQGVLYGFLFIAMLPGG